MDILADPSSWISSVGFPIAVAAYLLVELRKDIQALRDEVRNLAGAVGSCPLKRVPAGTGPSNTV